jgi:hypothetical protein
MEMCMENILLCASDQQNYGKKNGEVTRTVDL